MEPEGCVRIPEQGAEGKNFSVGRVQEVWGRRKNVQGKKIERQRVLWEVRVSSFKRKYGDNGTSGPEGWGKDTKGLATKTVWVRHRAVTWALPVSSTTLSSVSPLPSVPWITSVLQISGQGAPPGW